MLLLKKMTKLIGLSLILIEGSFVLSTAYAASINDLEAASKKAFIEQTVSTWMKKNDVPGVAVQVYSEGKPASYYFGVENKRTQSPVNGKTIFEVGSMTKLFTCLLAAEEINSGKIKLKDSVTKYLPHLDKSFQSINLLNVSTYTAGLPFNVPEEIKTEAELSHYLAEWHPSSPVGTKWTYSNISIGLLGAVLESESHENINALYHQRLLQPLKMQPIGFDVPDNLESHYAQGYDQNGDSISPPKTDFFPASWNIKLSAQDAAIFLKAALNMPDTPSEVMKAMKITQTGYFKVQNYQQGLGWVIYPMTYPMSARMRTYFMNPPEEMDRGPLSAQVIPEHQQKFDGSALMDKTGATYGFRSYIVVIPNKKSGVVILANRYVSNGEIVKLGREILLNLDKEVIY